MNFSKSIRKICRKIPKIRKTRKKDSSTFEQSWHKKIIDGFFSPDSRCYILDTETTGLVRGSRIVELCILSMDGRIVYNGMFNPTKPMPKDATRINGITDDMLKDKPLFAQEAYEIYRILHGSRVIAWNSSFDSRMISYEMDRVDDFPPYMTRWVDLMQLYCRIRNIEGGRISLAEAMKREGLERTEAHRAEGDCRDVLEIIRKLRNEL